jgi:hypothetical protein
MNHSIEKPGSVMVPRRAALIGVGVAAFVILLVGGYGFNWSWTGFSTNDHLWEWMQLLVYPVALAVLPVWLKTHHRWGMQWWIALGVVVATFVVLVIGGYALNWTWTGFQGNTLWDWWKLLLVPFVLPVVLAWLSVHHEEVSAQHRHETPAPDQS